jgi:cell wall-associated NlpC family hydrolase
MSHGKHRASSRYTKISRVAITTGAIATVAGLSFGVAVPAQAATSMRDEAIGSASYAAYVQDAEQSVTVSAADTADSSVVRDGVSATAESTLQAQAAAAAQAAEAAANLRSAGVAGYTGGIIPAAGTDGAAIIAYAQQFVGVVPYVDSPSAVSPSTGFECDSFVDWVFAHTTGQILPRGVNEIAALGTVIPESAAVAGDLVVYPGQHIGIYAGGGMMVDAPAPGQDVSRQAVWGSPEYVRL